MSALACVASMIIVAAKKTQTRQRQDTKSKKKRQNSKPKTKNPKPKTQKQKPKSQNPRPKTPNPKPKSTPKQQTKGDGCFLCPHSRSLALARLYVVSFLHLVHCGALLVCLRLVLAPIFFFQKKERQKETQKNTH